MNRVDLKRRILGNDALPRLPWLARDLILTPHPGREHARHVLDAAASDTTLAAALRAEAGAALSAPLDDALSVRIDGAGLRRAALRAWASRATQTDGRSLNHADYWNAALRTAVIAEAIADVVESPQKHLAFAAGLLCNVGRPALDLAVDGGYTHRLEGPSLDGLPLLDSERSAYGADHTQAGKWLAEHWRLPDALISAIWLHHLSPEALQEMDGSGGLIEIVALAAMLSLVHDSDTPSAAARARAERLGLSDSALEKLAGQSGVSSTVLEVRDGSAGNASDVRPALDLSSRLRYWEALAEVLQAVRPPMPLGDALIHVAKGLQSAFGLAPGVAYLVDADGTAAACRWRDAEGEVSPILLDSRESASPLMALIARLAEARSGAGVDASGLICAPFITDGMVLGQIVFEADAIASSTRDATVVAVQRFAAACGNALQRCVAHEGLTSVQEKMAASLQRLEHTHRQSLRNARLDSAAILASGAAHQLNNPLAIISGRAQLLLNQLEDAEHSRGVETILRESRRAARILSELMQFARPGEPKFAEADVAGILRATASGLREDLEEKGIQIVEDAASPLPRVPVDAAQLEQVFTHILRNAAQSMRDGGKIVLRARPNSGGRGLVLQIEDTGPGIRPEAIDQVFEPFFTASDDAEPHTGLGLAVCRAIIDRHQGAITLHNNPSRGCTCTITLSATTPVGVDEAVDTAPPPNFDVAATVEQIFQEPVSRVESTVAEAAEPERREAEDVATAAGGDGRGEAIEARAGKRVLFADRDEDLREVLAEALRSRGYEVTTVPDGLEAHAALITGQFDLAIAELSLPALSGRDLLEQSRSRAPGLPVIILAGAAAPDEDIVALEEAGADLCLRKPFGLEQLLEEMERLLEEPGLAKGA